MKIRIFELFDYILFLCVVCLITLGVLFIYSSGINSEGVNLSREYIKQIVWGGTGIILMLAMALYDYRRSERYLPYLYAFFAGLLILTRVLGARVNGARSWLGFGGFGIQPSEFCKIVFIMFISFYYEKSKNEEPLRRFIKACIILCIPMGLILVQPDLGTASVYIPIFLVISFMAGVPLRYILLVLLGGIATVVFAMIPFWQDFIAQKQYSVIRILTSDKLRLLVTLTCGIVAIIGIIGKIFFRENKYYYWIAYVFGILCVALIFSKVFAHVLKDYQIKRLLIFLDPSIDPMDAGWNIRQSKIAIGSGSWFGRGYLRGTQSHLRFLPQQSTDFIFSILAEEFGFFGCMMVYFFYFVILIRTIYIIKVTSNSFGVYIASGILAMFFFHFMVNVGMVMGIMPITGIPLLFLSYGGSSLWTAMMCIGLLMSVHYHRFEYNF